jgi:hypothetical protein
VVQIEPTPVLTNLRYKTLELDGTEASLIETDTSPAFIADVRQGQWIIDNLCTPR